MAMGAKRTMIARVGVALSFLCGVIGLVAGLTDHAWKLWPNGWFTGGTLLAVISLFVLLEGTVAAQRGR